MRRAAVFDLDGTLVHGTSAERLFVPYLRQRGVLGARQLFAAGSKALTLPFAGRTAALRRNKRWLTGLEVETVREQARRFVREELVGRLSPAVLSRLEASRDEGYFVCLLTGAPDFLADEVGSLLEVHDTLGTELEVVDGCFTGWLAGPHYFDEAKRNGVGELAGRHGFNLAASIGFADHDRDVAFLECFGRGVAVEPKAALRREAQRRGWEVMEEA